MSDPQNVNPQVVDALKVVQQATMSPQVVKTAGAGKAYQAVAQSTAIAIQDAADHLRNVSTISATAMGVALAQLLATGEPQYATVLQEAQGVVTQAAANFRTIGENAAFVLNSYPSGGS